MKTLLILLVSVSLSYGAVPTSIVSQYDLNKRTQLIEWIEQLKGKADQADALATQAQSDLATSESQRQKAVADIAELKSQIDSLAKERDQLQNQVTTLQTTIATLTQKLEKSKAEAHRNAVERDIILYAFAFAAALVVVACYGQVLGFVTKIMPAAAPFGLLIMVGVAVATFWAAYGAARGVLAVIASKL
jgi:F0F1-type ATP synthase assembly protein I